MECQLSLVSWTRSSKRQHSLCICTQKGRHLAIIWLNKWLSTHKHKTTTPQMHLSEILYKFWDYCGEHSPTWQLWGYLDNCGSGQRNPWKKITNYGRKTVWVVVKKRNHFYLYSIDNEIDYLVTMKPAEINKSASQFLVTYVSGMTENTSRYSLDTNTNGLIDKITMT